MTLYNARHAMLQGLLVTKWDRYGNVEAMYEVSPDACTCPAGHRHTCRHRQMLPLLEPIANTHWFLDWDNGRQVVDFQGMTKAGYDNIERWGPKLEPEGPMKQDTLCVDEGCPQSNTEHVCVTLTSAEGIHVEEDTPIIPVQDAELVTVGGSPAPANRTGSANLSTGALPWRRI